mgnify:CR=1 FL=1
MLVLVIVIVIEFPHKAAETRRRIREEYPPITQMAQILFRVALLRSGELRRVNRPGKMDSATAPDGSAQNTQGYLCGLEALCELFGFFVVL